MKPLVSTIPYVAGGLCFFMSGGVAMAKEDPFKDPKPQVGSRAPERVKTLSAEASGKMNKSFSRCVYIRSKKSANALLASSDPLHVSANDIFAEKDGDFKVHECLQSMAMLRALKLQTNIINFRAMMAEEAYLASHSTAPERPATETLGRKSVSASANAKDADGLMALADCITFNDTSGADALLRTFPDSDDERSAAIAIAPTVGGCLRQGQSFKMTPKMIRALVADGMWARYARTTH